MLQILSASGSTFLPAIINFSNISLAVFYLDTVQVGISLLLLSVFYVCIDVFNFGTSRMVLLDENEVGISQLCTLDLLSGVLVGLLSLVVFALIGMYWIDFTYGFILIVAATAFCYSLAHAPIGYFKKNSMNHIVLLILSVESFFRILITFLFFYYDIDFSGDYLFSVWLLCEVFHGLAFYFVFRFLGSYRPVFLKFGNVFSNKVFYESWGSNIVQTFHKNVDSILIGLLLPVSFVADFRFFKGIINLFSNAGSALGYVVFFNYSSFFRLVFCFAFVATFLFFLVYFMVDYLSVFDVPMFKKEPVFYSVVFVSSLIYLISRVWMVNFYKRGNSNLFFKVAIFESILYLLLLVFLSHLFGFFGALLAFLVTSVFLISFLSFWDSRVEV